jgi:hypothetical protein
MLHVEQFESAKTVIETRRRLAKTSGLNFFELLAEGMRGQGDCLRWPYSPGCLDAKNLRS